MRTEMSIERFVALAAAYGGDLRRWPDAERDAAQAVLAAHGEAARRTLDGESDLDAVLHLAPAPAPTSHLRQRILAQAPRPGRFRGIWRWRGPSWLAPGAGLAAACCAGAVLGALATRHAESQLAADSVIVASADVAAADPEVTGVR